MLGILDTSSTKGGAHEVTILLPSMGFIVKDSSFMRVVAKDGYTKGGAESLCGWIWVWNIFLIVFKVALNHVYVVYGLRKEKDCDSFEN